MGCTVITVKSHCFRLTATGGGKSQVNNNWFNVSVMGKGEYREKDIKEIANIHLDKKRVLTVNRNKCSVPVRRKEEVCRVQMHPQMALQQILAFKFYFLLSIFSFLSTLTV